MKFVAFLSALLGVAVGLLFGLLLWGGAHEPAAAPATANGKLDAEMLATLRDIRTQLERQAPGARLAGTENAAAPTPIQPEPLNAAATAQSVADFQAALDAAIAALHRVADEGGGGFSNQLVSPDAPKTVEALLDTEGKGAGKVPELFGCSPREVYARLGKPTSVETQSEGFNWNYYPDWPDNRRSVSVRFTGGYVSSWWARKQ